jgi:hypothetical protein
MSDTQCCAYSETKRCKNKVINDSYHCEKHYDTARKMYIKYKIICDNAYKLDLNKKCKNAQETVSYLLYCYKCFNEAYTARMTHRKYAFVPECYDAGHDFQFIMLQNKIKECEIKLQEAKIILQKLEKAPENLFQVLDDEEPSEIIEITIKQSVEVRKKEQEDVDALVEKYIAENNEYVKICIEMNNIINEYVNSFLAETPYVGDQIFIYFIWRIVFRLYSMQYFKDGFKPAECFCGACDNQVPYQLLFSNPKYKEKIKKMMANFNSYIFLNSMCFHCVDYFCELLLYNREKIEPVLEDMLQLYEKYTTNFITTDFILIWDVKLNRVVMRQMDIRMPKNLTLKQRLRYKFETRKQLEQHDFIDLKLACGLF